MGLTEYIAAFRVEIKRFAGDYFRSADGTPVVVAEEVLALRATGLQSARGDGGTGQPLAYLRSFRRVRLLESYGSHGDALVPEAVTSVARDGRRRSARADTRRYAPVRADVTAHPESFFILGDLSSVVQSDWVAFFPPWLLLGVVGGLVASLVVAGVFLVGGRLFPDDPVPRGPRIDGTGRRRAEIRDYLRTIGEPFVEDHSVHGETVAFYLPRRDVSLTFDAQAYFRLERTGTYTVLCEHEMPAHGLGRRLPFEVPTFEPATRTRENPVRASFDHLGVSTTAGPAEVKRAYREKVKQAHPDRGGSQSEFKELQEAYAKAREHAEGATA